MDRVDDADDNAERLFEHLRVARTDINAWFVVQKGTDDGGASSRAYGERVIAYGSMRWKALLLHCVLARLVAHAPLGDAGPGRSAGCSATPPGGSPSSSTA